MFALTKASVVSVLQMV